MSHLFKYILLSASCLLVSVFAFAQRYEFKSSISAKQIRLEAAGQVPQIILQSDPVFVEFAYNSDRQMYVLDEENACVFVIGEDGGLLRIIKSFETTTGKQELRSPRHIAVDRFNNLFVYDSKPGHIFKIPPKGDAVVMGAVGSNIGQLGEIIGLVTDSKGLCYALNRSRNVVDVYSAEGAYITWISGALPFNRPLAIGMNGADELYVLEEEGPTVIVFSDEGNIANTNAALGTRKNVVLKDAVAMAVMENGDFFVLDAKTCIAYHFNRVGDLVGRMGSKGDSSDGVFKKAVRLSSANGSIKCVGVLDEETNVVQTFEMDQLKPFKKQPSRRIKMIDSSTRRKPVFDLAVSSTGLRYTIPTDNRAKVIAYRDTSEVDVFTISGIIKEAAAVACDTMGNLYVADRGSGEILMFDTGGSLLRRMGKEIRDKLKNPLDIIIQNSGNLVVADKARGSLMQWNAQGQFVKEITSETNSTLLSPVRIDCDSKDQLYVWDDDLNAILRVGSGGWPTAEKQLRVRPGKPGGIPGAIGGFYVDPLDHIHVYNRSNHQIEVYAWEFEPLLVYSIGHPGNDALSIGDVDQMFLDSRTLNIYLTQDGGESQKVFHYLIPPPMPSGDMKFDVIDGKLVANFSQLKSKAVVAYGLTRHTATGDSVVYKTDGSSFVLKQSPTDQELYRYNFVALSWSDFSDAAMTFEDYFHYSEAMAHAHKYQEALGSWILTLETMGSQSGMTEHIARRMAEVSSEVLLRQDIELALSYVKEAYKLAPKSSLVTSKYRDAVMAGYTQWVNQREINKVIGDMQVHMNNLSLKKIYLETADTLARVLSLQENLNSINDAIKVQKKLIEWDKNPQYSYALGFSFFELYKFKSIRETSALELRSILEEALANSRDAYNLLKSSEQSYFASHLILLAAMNELGKFDEAQMQATAELGASSSNMSKEVQLAYRLELAKAFAAQGNLAGAEAEYMTILGLDIANRTARESLIEVLIQESKFDGAYDALRQLMQGKDEVPAYTLLLGRIALLKGNSSEAIFQLEKVLSKDPSLKQTFIYLADAYFASGKVSQARKYYDLSIQYLDEMIAKVGQGKRNKQFIDSLPAERLRILNAIAQITDQLQDYKSSLVAAQRLVKLQETTAENHYIAGNACIQLGRMYNAIQYYNRAIALSPDERFQQALASARQLQTENIQNSTPLSLGDVLVNEIFPSIYKNYSDVHQLPAGEFIVTNNTDAVITPSSITVFCPEVMSSPTQVNCIPIITRSNSLIRFPVLFAESILENTEAVNLQMEVVVVYTHNGLEQTVRKSGAFVLNGRNAIIWSDKRRMASFIAPGSEMLVDYNKRADQVFKGMPKFGVNRSVLKAGQLYTLLNQSDLAYSSDPNQGYSSLSVRTEVKDFLQFPLETFERKGGDCDDLVALYASLLENGGVPCAYIDVPGHVMAAFDCGIKPNDMTNNGLLPTDVIVMNDRVWIPIEATKIGTAGFFQAWKAAADRYYRELEAGHFPELIPFADAWSLYKPASYQPKGLFVDVPADNKTKEEYRQFVVQFVTKTKQNTLDELAARCQAEPQNTFVRNEYGTLLTQTGQYEKARKIFAETLEMTPESAIVINNIANIDFLQGSYTKAIANYELACQLDDRDAQIHVNLCKAHLQLGDKAKAREQFDKAVKLDSSISDIYQELKKQIQ